VAIVARDLRFLNRVCARMQQLRFPVNDPLWREAQRARNAMQNLLSVVQYSGPISRVGVHIRRDDLAKALGTELGGGFLAATFPSPGAAGRARSRGLLFRGLHAPFALLRLDDFSYAIEKQTGSVLAVLVRFSTGSKLHQLTLERIRR
jgi:hypothetical protein